MNLTVKTVVLGGCILLSLGITFLLSNRNANKEKDVTAGLVGADAFITAIQPARVTSHGMLPPVYTIKFTASDGKEYTQGNSGIKGSYAVGDKLSIYYNPANPNDPVVQKK